MSGAPPDIPRRPDRLDAARSSRDRDSIIRSPGGRADLILSCGDISDQVILEAAKAHSCEVIFAVRGNHDSPEPFGSPITDLHLRVVEHGGIRFGGLGGSWKYKPRGQFLLEQREVEDLLSTFPEVVIFLSHDSPTGIHDSEDEANCGFYGLRTYV